MTAPWNFKQIDDFEGVDIADIFQDLRAAWLSVKNEFDTDTIRVRSNPRPDLLSTQIYGQPDYWWIILVLNDVVDGWNDWPKDPDELRAWAEEKYDDPQEIRHYVDPDTGKEFFDVIRVGNAWYDAGDPGGIQEPLVTGDLQAVTFLEYEDEINTSRRRMEFVVPGQIRDCRERLFEELGIDGV